MSLVEDAKKWFDETYPKENVDSLAKELGCKPEEVFARVFALAVQELLREEGGSKDPGEDPS